MSNRLSWLVPIPPPPSTAFGTFEITRQFYREVKCREDFDRYCQWYQITAAQHRQELVKMRRDINVFGLFCRKHF